MEQNTEKESEGGRYVLLSDGARDFVMSKQVLESLRQYTQRTHKLQQWRVRDAVQRFEAYCRPTGWGLIPKDALLDYLESATLSPQPKWSSETENLARHIFMVLNKIPTQSQNYRVLQKILSVA